MLRWNTSSQLFAMPTADSKRAEAYLRRRYAADRALAAMLLVLASPLRVALATWVVLCDGRPALYWDVRVVAGGAQVRIPKLRTYRRRHDPGSIQREADGRLSVESAEQDLLPGARPIRLVGLDELPQLVSVIRGEMALIGPRPQPPEFDVLNDWRPPWLRPGLLAVAAAGGRRALSIDERLQIDRRYAVEASLRRDVAIVLRTALALAKGTR